MGENHFASLPVACYGTVLLLCGIAYFILTATLIAHHGQDSALAIALGKDLKGKGSLLIYAIAIPLSFLNSILACSLYVLVAILWLIPDSRIERTFS
jgi:uncharacterized membrane protein